MDINLENRLAVVTGATGQLGRVIVRSFALCGADVVVCYFQNKEMAEELVSELISMGRRALAIQVDVTDEESVYKLRGKVKVLLGDADIIVNCALSMCKWTTVLNQDAVDYYNQFESCVMQSVYTAKAFLPSMIEKGWGRFIGINTESSMLCNARTSIYASAKRGMDGFYRVLAKEVGTNAVTVNQVAPGWIITDKDRKNGTSSIVSYTNKVPLKRRGTDQEVANVVMFLASDLASFITGVCIPVDGGHVML